MRTRSLAAASFTALLLLGCGGLDQPGGSPDPGEETTPEEAAGEDEAPEVPEEPEGDDPFEDFDRDEARRQAESYLGVDEDDIEEAPMVRIVRRGDEDYMVTMDLRPGRLNLELDDDGSGTYVVTRVVVETPDDDGLVIE